MVIVASPTGAHNAWLVEAEAMVYFKGFRDAQIEPKEKLAE
jgi:hypothetical protein